MIRKKSVDVKIAGQKKRRSKEDWATGWQNGHGTLRRKLPLQNLYKCLEKSAIKAF
jgi:hypothetical protein